MKMRKMLFTSVLAVVLLVSGCGQKKMDTAGQTFGSMDQTTIESSVPSPLPTVSAQPVPSVTPDKAVPSESPKPTPEPVATTTVTETQPTPLPSPKVAESPKAVQSTPPQVDATNVKTDAAPSSSPQPKPAVAEPSKTVKPSPASNEINWDQFFDNEKQDTPSDRFWDMSGKTVQIKGFMGEVLSFEKHWFLLIPKPGAECPFDNGDETYWNKIMIVFVPDDVKLRYTSGPLLITGKLDVGVKLDESGYKTMFRLYDASFEKIKE
ncbi:hypothetical protein HZF08_07600 [Paenibacillus sp. CGMCC 1.16610]|uniref:Lipoprotein n=2 Tax=Paenibacillus TaxID=44249 RepID=A0ABW9UAX8_9BACL|nr:hypothetical protein [Paenibacillus sp. CGMCC 1.16610]MVQ37224.1 hypothetical protein [Paenibacillus anseongense]